MFSPDGSRLAFAAGCECRDRLGIFLVRAGTYLSPLRVSNDCRILGTAGDGTRRGTPLADVLAGLGGDDRLFALDPSYVGDSLRGGAGDDLLVGGYRADVLAGGPGNDRLLGGHSADELFGGPGSDRIRGQEGQDVVHAADGQRDVVSCGTNAPGTPERDEVFADRFDRVADDCETVR